MGFLKGFLDASFWLINYVLITYWLNRLNWVAVKFSVGWNGGRTKAKKATESSFHRVHLLFASLFHGMNKTGSVWSEGRTPISSLFNILLVTNQLALFLLMLVTPALNRRTTAQYSLDFNRVKLLDIMKQSKPSSSQNVRLNLGNNVPFYLFIIIFFFFFFMFSTHTHTHGVFVGTFVKVGQSVAIPHDETYSLYIPLSFIDRLSLFLSLGLSLFLSGSSIKSFMLSHSSTLSYSNG